MEKFQSNKNESIKTSKDFEVLRRTWQEALNKMNEVSEEKRRNEIMNLTAVEKCTRRPEA